jgi:DNA segregation ATPase FtsK/SpoIIIE, S-DNA-T family
VGTHCARMELSTIPPCEATGPDGARMVVHPHAATDSVADLARALDLPAAVALTIDGRSVAPHERLVATGLRVGSAVTVRPPASTPSAAASDGSPAACDGVTVAVGVGPACERWITLPPGRHMVGRAASARIRIDDPSVELHHGVLDVAADGSAAFTQLTGSFPATVDGVPCGARHHIGPGSDVSIGTSRLLFGGRTGGVGMPRITGGSIVPADRDPWRSVVRRGPSDVGEATPPALDVPESPAPHRAPPLTALVGAGIAAVGAGLLAAVLGQVLFAVFAAVGAVASLTTWAVGALVARRDRRRAEATHRAALVEFERALLRAHVSAEREHRVLHRSVVDALELIHGDGSGLWSRRCGSSEALWATIGRGTSRWLPPIANDDRDRLSAGLLVTLDRCERLDDVAVPIPLEPSSVVALRGVPMIADALCRSVLVQLAATYGPADWELVVVTHHPERWSWTTWLPHAHLRPCVVAADDSAAVADAMARPDHDTGPGRRTVIVLDAPALLSSRTGPVRRRLERGDVSCVTLLAPDAPVPAVVDRVLELGDTGAAEWIETSASPWTAADREIVVAGLSLPTAEAAARRLAPLIDPEDHDGVAGTPADVSLALLEPVGTDAAATIARRWRHAGPDPAPVARLGMSADGIVDVDLVRDGPHGLVAGTTGSGKSELLRTLVVSLAAQVGPDHVTMILVDFKGGSTFDVCALLPHTVGVVTDLDDGLAERVLVSLDAEVRRRERLLRDAQVDDLAAYRRAIDDPLPRLVVVVDEFASLAKELPDFLGALVAIAQRGRSLGIHLLLATQRPAGVITDDIRANTNLRIALRLQDRSDAGDVVGDAAPAGFPLGAPGRAAMRLGPDELVVFQTANSAGALPVCSGRLRVEHVRGITSRDASGGAPPVEGPSVLEHLVDSIRQAAAMVGTADPHRPWIDALPAVIRPGDLTESNAVGVLDDPANQCRRPLSWTPATGNLLLVGAVGAGTTTAAVAVAARCVSEWGADALHVYVVDAQGDAAWTGFESLPHCGAVVRVGELERLTRLLARLAGELDRRATDGRREPAIVILIDGFAAVRDALGEVAHGEAARRLDRVLRDGPSVGIVAAVTTDGASSSGIVVPRATTWVFHVVDQGIARTAGLRAPVVAARVPGRLRVAESGLEGQIVLDPEPLGTAIAVDPALGSGDGPAPVLVLPEFVDSDELATRCASGRSSGRSSNGCSGRPVEVLIGLDADDIEPAVLRVPVGDHVFIGGGARTGRSTALRQVEASWRRSNPGCAVVRVERDRAIDHIDDVDGELPVLVVVDDAERVDDPAGVLARLAARSGVTFAVAARLDAVRVAYGHWTREVARSRCGLIMTSMGDVDGELLGATLPRRSPIPPRPGLAWIVDHDGHRLVQVAARMPA